MEAGYPDLAVPPPPSLKPSRPNHLKQGSPHRKANQEGRANPSIDNLSERLSNSSISFSVAESESEADKSDLESESEEESTGDEEEQELSGFESFDLHPVHSTPSKQSVSFLGCKNVREMATAAAADTNIGVRQHRLIRTQVLTGAGEFVFFLPRGKSGGAFA